MIKQLSQYLDSTANMIRMMVFIPGHITHNPFLSHFLQFAINDEVLEKFEIKNLILNVRVFTNYAAHSSVQLSDSAPYQIF